MELNGIKIEPGMVIEVIRSKEKEIFVAFPIKGEELAFINYSKENNWKTAQTFKEDIEPFIIKIKGLSEGKLINDGKILWEKKEEIIITVDEILKKFNIPSEKKKLVKIKRQYEKVLVLYNYIQYYKEQTHKEIVSFQDFKKLIYEQS